jgi:hypothetical protein
MRELCLSRKTIWSIHSAERMFRRRITREDIRNALLTSEIIEQYPSDYPYPSCLIMGITSADKKLHVVCAIGADQLFIVTAYYPDNEHWEPDMKTRKKA